MPWQIANNLLRGSMNRKGLAQVLDATSLCCKAEQLAPGLFKAISVRNGVLHIEIHKSKTLALKLVEGLMLAELNAFAATRHLTPITKIRLTFSEDSVIV